MRAHALTGIVPSFLGAHYYAKPTKRTKRSSIRQLCIS
jgi:hypothetical protein